MPISMYQASIPHFVRMLGNLSALLDVEADLAMKDHALAKHQEPSMKPLSYSTPDSLLQFLKSL